MSKSTGAVLLIMGLTACGGLTTEPPMVVSDSGSSDGADASGNDAGCACPTNQVCVYTIPNGCAAKPTCMTVGTGSCTPEDVCGCDGKTTQSCLLGPITGGPIYSLTPTSHPGPCL